MKSFPRFWTNHPWCRNKLYMKAFSLWVDKRKKNEKQNNQNKMSSSSTNSQYFLTKISWIAPWVSRIYSCEGHWCCSIYMVMRLSCIFCLFLTLCRTASFSPDLSPMKNNLAVHTIFFFCTMDGFFRILEKTSFHLLCTRLYLAFYVIIDYLSERANVEVCKEFSHMFRKHMYVKNSFCLFNFCDFK